MKYKFYKTTDKDFINKLAAIREQRKAYADNVNAVKEEVGASEWMQYSNGSVACFLFETSPDKASWKKAESGFMPKIGDKKVGKVISDKLRSVKPGGKFNDVLKDYNFPSMVLGEATNRGVKMHSSSLCGDFEKGAFFVRVPQEKSDTPFIPPEIFTEVREWEMLKFMDDKAA